MASSRQDTLFEDSGPAQQAERLKTLLKQWKALAGPLDAVARVKLERADGLDALRKALEKVADGTVFQKAVEDLRESTQAALQDEQKSRKDSFRRAEANLIKELRQAKTPLKELDAAWRVGPLELQVRREQAQARILYNREQLIGWAAASSPEDLKSLLAQGERLLDKGTVPSGLWVETLWDAYQHRSASLGKEAASRSVRVPILDFFREVRVSLVRMQLSTGQPDKALKFVDLRKWAILYNLDLYRSLPAEEKKGRLLAFETGSQKEQGAGKGLVLNGLSPLDDYKVLCFVTAAGS